MLKLYQINDNISAVDHINFYLLIAFLIKGSTLA